jgi:hypothetical protein
VLGINRTKNQVSATSSLKRQTQVLDSKKKSFNPSHPDVTARHAGASPNWVGPPQGVRREFNQLQTVEFLKPVFGSVDPQHPFMKESGLCGWGTGR